MLNPVMAVDVGSATISAAATLPTATPDPAVLTVNGHPTYAPNIKVDIEGVPHPSTWRGDAVDQVDRPDLMLDKPPQIVGDVPLSGATLVGVSIGPALAAAAAHFGREPTVLVGVHPAWWSTSTTEDYHRALRRVAPHTALMSWPEAIAAQTMPPTDASHVTVLDFGASTATIAVVAFSRRGAATVAYTHTDRKGGSRGADRAVVAVAATDAGIDLGDCSRSWWDSAGNAVAQARTAAHCAGTPLSDEILIDFPAPLAPRAMFGHVLKRVTTEHMQRVVASLVSRDQVQQAWAADRTTTNTTPIIEVVGGFAHDPAVMAAVKAEAGCGELVPEPASAAVFGAALATAPQWVPPKQKPSKFRIGKRRPPVPASREQV